MSQVEINEAANDLPGRVERVRNGEDVTLADRGRAMARLLPAIEAVVQPRPPRRTGVAEGKVLVPDAGDAPLPDDPLELFYEGPLFPGGPAPDGFRGDARDKT